MRYFFSQAEKPAISPAALSYGPPITPFSGASANFEASHYSIRLTPTTAPLEWRLPGSGAIDGLRLRGHHRLRARLPLCRIRHVARASDCSRFMTFETGSNEVRIVVFDAVSHDPISSISMVSPRAESPTRARRRRRTPMRATRQSLIAHMVYSLVLSFIRPHAASIG